MKLLIYPHILAQSYILDDNEFFSQSQGESESLLEIRNQFLAPYRNRKVSKGKVKEDKIREDKVVEAAEAEPGRDGFYGGDGGLESVCFFSRNGEFRVEN